MKKFISKISEDVTNQVNPDLFNRRKGKQIWEYIVDGMYTLEALPYIKFVGHEIVKDCSEIDIKLNRRHLKNKAIQREKDITKILSIDDTAMEMLKMDFKVDYDGDTRYITKKLLIPSYVDDYHLYIDGKEVLPINQLVDMSTYNHKNVVKLKTTLTPIQIYKQALKYEFESTCGKSFKMKTFVLDLFEKKTNPLYYYAAKMNLRNTINYFSMKGIVDVSTEEYNSELNYYFRVNKNLFVEADKRFFHECDFVKMFTYMVYDLFNARSKIEIIDDVDYWKSKLGSIFTSNTKNQINKGDNVLVSFGRILDNITKSTLRFDDYHLQSTHSLIRWILHNFKDLRKKDNHHMENKRLRCNELLAYYFLKQMSKRINSLLNKKKLLIESIERMKNVPLYSDI